MIYVYRCNRCDNVIEVKKPMRDSGRVEVCFNCGQEMVRVWAPIPALFGWRLTNSSHERFSKDEWERDI